MGRVAEKHERFIVPPARASIDGERLIAVFTNLVEPLGRSLPASSEVVLHDLSLLPNSIVAIHGDVTGRRVGDPATDLLLRKVSDLSEDHLVGYETRMPDGRTFRSSTMLIRDISGTAVAALCINTDLSSWRAVKSVIDMIVGDTASVSAGLSAVPTRTADEGTAPADGNDAGIPEEVFVRDVDELAAHLIDRAVASVGVPIELMQKRHKIEVVRDLKSRGIFMLRDAVDTIATTLGVTRFTIYNYLNEISEQDDLTISEKEPS